MLWTFNNGAEKERKEPVANANSDHHTQRYPILGIFLQGFKSAVATKLENYWLLLSVVPLILQGKRFLTSVVGCESGRRIPRKATTGVK